MRFPSVLFLAATGVCVMAQQAPPGQKAPAAPAGQAIQQPRMTGPDGTIMPLEIAPAAPKLPSGRVVVQVGDIIITAGQMEQILDAYSESQRVFVNGPGRQQFIDQLVRVLVLSQEGKRLKLDQTDRYRNQLAYSAAGILSSHAEEDIRKNVKIDDAMLQAYLAEHPLDYMQVRARHILIRMHGAAVPLQPGAKDLMEAEALAKAQELRKKIDGGADFAAIASTESDDISTKEKGGDLGFFRRGQMPPSIEEAAFAMKAGEVSQPVRTSMGYTVIKVEEAKPVKTFEELRPELDKRLRSELTRKYVDSLKALTTIEVDPEFASTGKSVTAVK
jgi:peptidyl-prolyl cis-trans isomerase C